MKNQALCSLKGKSKKIKCRLLQVLFGALRFKSLLLTAYNLFSQSFQNISVKFAETDLIAGSYQIVRAVHTCWSSTIYKLQDISIKL